MTDLVAELRKRKVDGIVGRAHHWEYGRGWDEAYADAIRTVEADPLYRAVRNPAATVYIEPFGAVRFKPPVGAGRYVLVRLPGKTETPEDYGARQDRAFFDALVKRHPEFLHECTCESGKTDEASCPVHRDPGL